jgi:hypothetical protein
MRIPSLSALAIVAALAVPGASCLSSTEPPETLLWEGVLLVEAGGPPDIAGTAAMVALRAETRVGIGLTGGVPGTVFGWSVRTGTCLSPGTTAAPANAFPAVTIGNDETGESETTIQRRLTGTEYAVQLVENADGSGAVLACADLERRT